MGLLQELFLANRRLAVCGKRPSLQRYHDVGLPSPGSPTWLCLCKTSEDNFTGGLLISPLTAFAGILWSDTSICHPTTSMILLAYDWLSVCHDFWVWDRTWFPENPILKSSWLLSRSFFSFTTVLLGFKVCWWGMLESQNQVREEVRLLVVGRLLNHKKWCKTAKLAGSGVQIHRNPQGETVITHTHPF